MAKTIPFPAGKTAPGSGNRPAAKPPAGDDAVPAELRERRDLAIAHRLATQNEITRGVLITREEVARVLSGVSGAWRATIPEHSYSAAPLILAVLEEKTPPRRRGCAS